MRINVESSTALKRNELKEPNKTGVRRSNSTANIVKPKLKTEKFQAVEKSTEKIVEKIVEVVVEKIVKVEVFVDKIVEKEVIVEKPILQYIDRIVQREKIVEKPVNVIQVVEKLVYTKDGEHSD